MNNVKTIFLKTLSEELSNKELNKAYNLIHSELNSSSFKNEINKYGDFISDKKTHFIIIGLLLGLGRNRIIKSMSEYDVKRNQIEDIQDLFCLESNSIKNKNEKIITKLKWETNSRIKRQKALSTSWEDIKQEYLSGISPDELSKKYDVSKGVIKSQLEDENLIDVLRNTMLKKELADNNEDKIDDDFIINLVKNNTSISIVSLWRIAKEKYPWLLRRQFYSKIEELNLCRSKWEINMEKSFRAKSHLENDLKFDYSEESIANEKELLDNMNDGTIEGYILSEEIDLFRNLGLIRPYEDN